MKKTIISSILVLLGSVSIYAQKLNSEKVPSYVLSAFKNKFPEASNVKWELENKTTYEAEFKMNDMEVSANFNNLGDWLETETEIKSTEIPEIIKETLSKDFSGYKINEASKLESTVYGNCFELEIQNVKETIDVIFAQDGIVLNKSKEEKSR